MFSGSSGDYREIFIGKYCIAKKSWPYGRQTERQNFLFAITITNMMINKETVKKQEISLKIEAIAGMETTL